MEKIDETTKKEILFALSKNGIEIFWDPHTSHASTHFQDSPGLQEVVKEVLRGIDVGEEGIQIEVDTGKVVGVSGLVETREGDEIVYALRPLRTLYSRFVKH